MKKQAKRRQIAQQRQAQKRSRRGRAVDHGVPLPPKPRGQLLSHVPREVEEYGLALLRRIDPMAGLRAALGEIAEGRGDWAGIPMPMEGAQLVVEPTYPKAQELMAMCAPPAEDPDGLELVNKWFSRRHRRNAYIMRDRTGRLDWGLEPVVHHGGILLKTLGAADAWGIEQEGRAVQLLGTLLRHRAFKQYLLTGMFLETSPRSGVHYLFRKLRPTLALRDHGNETRILCALCLHPIAYYSGSWAGGMCPTDDVIAHLVLCRGDEHMFWKRANQHPPWKPQAGL